MVFGVLRKAAFSTAVKKVAARMWITLLLIQYHFYYISQFSSAVNAADLITFIFVILYLR